MDCRTTVFALARDQTCLALGRYCSGPAEDRVDSIVIKLASCLLGARELGAGTAGKSASPR